MVKKINIIIITIMMLLLTSVCFGELPEFDFTYSNSPSDLSVNTDSVTRISNAKEMYEGHDMPLPNYIPHSVWDKLYIRNDTYNGPKFAGRHVPRYFDGERYTTLRTQGFNPENLTANEKDTMEQLALYVQHEKNTARDCELTTYLQTSKNLGEQPNFISSDDTTELYSVYYAYDMGYFYVPEIQDLFKANCEDTFTNYYASGDYLYFDSNTLTFRRHELIENLCDSDSDNFIMNYLVNAVALRIFYNVSSNQELAMTMYDDPTVTINTDGTCTKGVLDYFCYPESTVTDIYEIVDDWMITALSGMYVPQSCDATLTNLYSTDDYFRSCYNLVEELKTSQAEIIWSSLEKGSTLTPIAGLYTFISLSVNKIGLENRETYFSCQDYLSDKKKILCDMDDDTSSMYMKDVLWKHYKTTFDIERDSNLHPFNIESGAIKCDDESNQVYSIDFLKGTVEGWDGRFEPQQNSLLPNRILPLIVCDYSNSTKTTHNISFSYKVKINPLWAYTTGAHNTGDAYDINFIRYMFPEGANIVFNQNDASFEISSYYVVDDEDEKCAVSMNVEGATKMTDGIDTGISKADKFVKSVPEVLRKLEDIEIALYNSEKDSNDFFSTLTNISILARYIMILFFYMIEAVLFFVMFRMLIQVPITIIDRIKNIGKSKQGEDL